jgi:transcriptional regulator with XRE-family HTH domain
MINHIRRFRQDAHLSQTELSLASRVPRYVISLAEHLGVLPSSDHQIKIAHALAQSVAKLFPPKDHDPAKDVAAR